MFKKLFIEKIVSQSTVLPIKAANFDFLTLSGTTWNFQSEWTGHDNYLFFAKYAASSYNTNLWNQNVGNLIEKLPDNGTHFFFASFDTTYHSDVYSKRSNVNSYLSTLSSEEEAYKIIKEQYDNNAKSKSQ